MRLGPRRESPGRGMGWHLKSAHQGITWGGVYCLLKSDSLWQLVPFSWCSYCKASPAYVISNTILSSLYLSVLLLQLPIVTDGIASSEPQVLSQLHIKACIATSVCTSHNIQNIIRPYN